MAKNKTKRIKILNKGMATTSRGRIRTPMLNPYKEDLNVILNMISVDNADVVEVMDDGTEVPLTIFNFGQDNSGEAEFAKRLDESKKKPEPVIKEEKVTTPVEKPLTRKQRRELERQKKTEEPKVVETPVVEETPVEEVPTPAPAEPTPEVEESVVEVVEPEITEEPAKIEEINPEAISE